MLYSAIAALFIFLWLWMRENSKRKELAVRYGLAEAQLIEKTKELEEVHVLHRIAEEKLLLLSQTQEALKSSFQSSSMEALKKTPATSFDWPTPH